MPGTPHDPSPQAPEESPALIHAFLPAPWPRWTFPTQHVSRDSRTLNSPIFGPTRSLPSDKS